MIAKSYGAGIHGLDPYFITIETDVQRGLPKFDIVGLAQSAVQEGKNRIQSALRNTGIDWGPKRITVNLAPASLKKDGAGLDLPIAMALLAGIGWISSKSLNGKLMLGELSLDGRIKGVRGAFAYAELALREGWRNVVLSPEVLSEVADLEGLNILAPSTLDELIRHFKEGISLSSLDGELLSTEPEEGQLDWSDVKGQIVAKRALEIAASGHHNVLMVGSPGIGKTLLARRLPTIMPPLDLASSHAVRRIRSVSGEGQESTSSRTPPFRFPHHNASLAGIIGGGQKFRPGEFTMAHCGVLFMDELPEFRRDILEALREPLECGSVTISRAEGLFHLPASFLFLGAMNLCPCGAQGDPKLQCICPPALVEKYRNRVSGPIRDRLDLVVHLSRPTWKELWDDAGGESSLVVRKRVMDAREIQKDRNRGMDYCNGKLPSKRVRKICQLGNEEERLLEKASEKFGMSARSIDKALRVARTIADLEKSQEVRSPHLTEALQYRQTMLSKAF